MTMGDIAAGFHRRLANAAGRFAQVAGNRLVLFAKRRGVRVDTSVTPRHAGAVRGDRWGACELVDERVAVRDENGLWVAWVLPGDAALVAAAPALLDVLRELMTAADDDPEWLPHARALHDARVLLQELDDGNRAPHDEAAAQRGEVHG